MSPSRPPFRADHVGSLLRPAELKDARAMLLKGEYDPAALKSLEDRYIRDAVRLQEDIGLYSITDGEFRRTSWQSDFLQQLGSTAGGRVVDTVNTTGQNDPRPGPRFTPTGVRISGKIRHTRPIVVDDFKFLKSLTARTAKVTIPSPTSLMRAGREGTSRDAYPDLDALNADTVAVYRAEIKLLADAGCRYLQIDDTNFAYLCDADMREASRQRGDDPDQMPARYARLINDAIADRPADMTICVHVCRGNGMGRWAAQGGYEPVAEALFNQVKVDGYFLEYDTDRAGGFEPLRFMPKSHKRVVLGLISTKTPQIEAKDSVKRRIDEAATHVPLENLCLSPQCGFASGYLGNPVTAEDQRRKLALVVETATEVWGTAQ